MRFRAICYRAHDPRWSFEPLSGEGAARRGARFNPKGAPALYLALTIMTAVKEINQGFAHKIEPCVLCSYEVDCEDIVERVARRLMDASRAGILVPSFAPGATAADQNLVLWKWGKALPHLVSVHDPSGRLPKDQLSWRSRPPLAAPRTGVRLQPVLIFPKNSGTGRWSRTPT